jgi:ketosteroid isomerase-like protein
MLQRTLLVLLASAPLASCAPKMTPQERSVEEQVVRDRATSWVRAFNNRQLDSLATFYLQTPELTVAWPDGQRTSGWEEESAAQREAFRGLSTVNLVAQDVRVEVFAPNVAAATFRHSTDEIRGTERDLFAGHGTMIWIKPDPRGQWLIRALQMSRSPAAPAEPSRRR